MHDAHTESARAAGEDHGDPASPCDECLYELAGLGEECNCCRDNPEPDPQRAFERPITWLAQSLRKIAAADYERIAASEPVDSPEFRAKIKQPLSDFIEDGQKLLDALESPVSPATAIEDRGQRTEGRGQRTDLTSDI